MSSNIVDNPFFGRMWTVMARHEPEWLKRLRQENLEGLSGRVLDVGAGSGTNFELYPNTVTKVVAVEPEHRLTLLAQNAGFVVSGARREVPIPAWVPVAEVAIGRAVKPS